MDSKDRKLILALQEGIPIASKPYRVIGVRLGASEEEVISRVKKLKDTGLIKRIDLRVDLKRVGFVTTLVACKIPDKEIRKAKDVILNYRNVTHNYLRKHELNMWFTLNAASLDKLRDLLADLKKVLKVERMLSFQTKNKFKLRFHLAVN